LVDVFPADQQPQIVAQLSSALEGIVCQRLIPRADGQGRVLASEVLVPGHGIRNCIRERKLEQIVGLMEIGIRDGNRTIDQSIESLLNARYITREEAIFHSRDHKTFEAPPVEPRKPKSIWT
jgi:twitching motility protein PilT